MRPSHNQSSTGAILFDLDGTLVDSAPAMTRALNEMTRRRGAPAVDIASVRRWVSLGGEAMLRGALGVTADPLSDLEEFRHILRGQTADPADLYPGVPGMLAALKQEGYCIAVCTNKRESLSRRLLQELELEGYFSAIAGRDTFPVAKPDPGHLTGTIRLAGGEPSRAVMVGDSDVDVRTAKAASVPVVLVSFGYAGPPVSVAPPEAVIDHFDELHGSLASLVSSTASRRTGSHSA